MSSRHAHATSDESMSAGSVKGLVDERDTQHVGGRARHRTNMELTSVKHGVEAGAGDRERHELCVSCSVKTSAAERERESRHERDDRAQLNRVTSDSDAHTLTPRQPCLLLGA